MQMNIYQNENIMLNVCVERENERETVLLIPLNSIC